jgi:excisionase family DNA binding protein
MSTTPTVSRRLLRASEVAKMLGIDPDYVRYLVKEGTLQSVRLGENGWHRFRIEDVERFLAGENTEPTP